MKREKLITRWFTNQWYTMWQWKENKIWAAIIRSIKKQSSTPENSNKNLDKKWPKRTENSSSFNYRQVEQKWEKQDRKSGQSQVAWMILDKRCQKRRRADQGKAKRGEYNWIKDIPKAGQQIRQSQAGWAKLEPNSRTENQREAKQPPTWQASCGSMCACAAPRQNCKKRENENLNHIPSWFVLPLSWVQNQTLVP